MQIKQQTLVCICLKYSALHVVYTHAATCFNFTLMVKLRLCKNVTVNIEISLSFRPERALCRWSHFSFGPDSLPKARNTNAHPQATCVGQTAKLFPAIMATSQLLLKTAKLLM